MNSFPILSMLFACGSNVVVLQGPPVGECDLEIDGDVSVEAEAEHDISNVDVVHTEPGQFSMNSEVVSYEDRTYRTNLDFSGKGTLKFYLAQYYDPVKDDYKASHIEVRTFSDETTVTPLNGQIKGDCHLNGAAQCFSISCPTPKKN